MDRRRFLLTSVAGVLAAPPTAWGQEPGKIWRIGILHPGRPPSPEDMARGPFTVAMRELGLVEGRNVLYQRRYANGQFELLPSLAAELLASDVHVILSVGNQATRAAKEATATTAIVFGEVSEPVQQGLVASLSRPGGNLTGLRGRLTRTDA